MPQKSSLKNQLTSSAAKLLQSNKPNLSPVVPKKENPVILPESSQHQDLNQTNNIVITNDNINNNVNENTIINPNININNNTNINTNNNTYISTNVSIEKTFATEYKRVGFYVHRDLIKALNKIAKPKGKGMKTVIVNEAIREYISSGQVPQNDDPISRILNRVKTDYEKTTFYIQNDIITDLDIFSNKFGGKGAKTRTIINAALEVYFKKHTGKGD